MSRPTFGRSLVKAFILSAVIQVPFFLLMTVGPRNEFGSYWFFFYLPAIILLSSPVNLFGSAPHSVMGKVVELAILQLLLVTIIIFLVAVLLDWLRQRGTA